MFRRLKNATRDTLAGLRSSCTGPGCASVRTTWTRRGSGGDSFSLRGFTQDFGSN